MCVYACICMCIYIYMCVCVCVYIYTCTNVLLYEISHAISEACHADFREEVQDLRSYQAVVPWRRRSLVDPALRTWTFPPSQLNTRACMCIYIYMYIYIHINMYMYTYLCISPFATGNLAKSHMKPIEQQ